MQTSKQTSRHNNREGGKMKLNDFERGTVGADDVGRFVALHGGAPMAVASPASRRLERKNMRGNRNRKPGESNPHHTLTRAQVARVRRLAGSARMKYGWKSALARDFGVTPSCIGDILSRRRWA